MKALLKRLLRTLLAETFQTFRQDLTTDFSQLRHMINNQAVQVLLTQHYQALKQAGTRMPEFATTGFRVYSQNEEDGYLLYIFALIGMETRRAVEICAGDGIECNSANLIVNHKWTGLLVDGNPANIERGRRFYATCPDTLVYPPTLVQAWVTAEAVNDLITQHGFAGDIDLLSLDLDGVDYWIWRAITCVNPRVVVVEFNNLWGADQAVTIPYDPHFVAEFSPEGPDYCGASLPAFVKLGREKGYRLVGCNLYGFNAFFVRNDLGQDVLPEIDPARCFAHPQAQYAIQHRRS
ncbi:MAG: hypothetical protein NZ772_18820, partial [Cyanobacteria bacterium]|nr:hypothetical protein [Cyanobacteriota bacterium]MDW8203289.1 hypothetical protein [Cyanobacteriota bacterium SKYGB_h_bin112]